MATSIAVFLRHDKPKKDGSANLCLRLNMDRKKVDVSLNKVLSPKKGITQEFLLNLPIEQRLAYYNWDYSNEKVTTGNLNKEKLNLFIASEKKRAGDIIVNYGLKNKRLTRETFKKEFTNKGNTKDLACQYFLNELEKIKDNYASETYRSYSSILTKLQDYKPTLTLPDLTEGFIREYEAYMLKPIGEEGKGNDKRTVANNMKVIKTFVNIAIKNGDILKEDNAFQDYRIKKGRPTNRRSFVEPDELKSLERLLINYQPVAIPIQQLSPQAWKEREEKGWLAPAEYNVLRYFLFSCYTGLRFKDIQLIQYSDIKKRKVKADDSNTKFVDRYFIDIDMHKTGFNVTIPLLVAALNLIDLEKKQGKIFHVISNQKTNKHLKAIIKKAKINKRITFHCARHTFASISLMYDLPEKFVQNVLGHQNSRTTEIYTHIVDDYLFRHANTLNEKMNSHVKVEPEQRQAEKTARGKLNLLERLATLDISKLEKAMKVVELLG